MRREDIIEELKRRGYEAEAYDKILNGVIKEGIVIRTEGGISPIVYVKEIMEKEEQGKNSVAHAANLVVAIHEAHEEPDIDKSIFLDRKYVLKHIHVGIQKKTVEYLEKGICPFDGMETYLYFNFDYGEKASVKLTPEYLRLIKVESTEAWEKAYKNTFAETTTIDMEEFVDRSDEPSMYIITNKSRQFGASAILDKKALRRLDEKIGNGTHKFFVLPSSVHEMIVIPYEDEYELEEMSELVWFINRGFVSPEERLTDRAYIMEL